MIEARQVGDDLADGPDQLADVGALLDDAVDLERDRAALHQDARRRDDLGDHGGVLEVLGEVPGAALVARGELQVAPRHVEAAGVAVDERARMLGSDAKASAPEDDDQLHLVMAVRRFGRVGDARAGFDQGLRRLDEVERPVAPLLDRPVSHLGGVRGVVAADAEDAVDRGAFGEAPDGQRGDGGRRPECGFSHQAFLGVGDPLVSPPSYTAPGLAARPARGALRRRARRLRHFATKQSESRFNLAAPKPARRRSGGSAASGPDLASSARAASQRSFPVRVVNTVFAESGACMEKVGPASGPSHGLARAVLLALSAFALAACNAKNAYVPPPPPKVVVAQPIEQPATLYFELTGNTTPFNSVDLVARVQGYLDSIDYKDGAQVKKGDLLFGIERDQYQQQLDQAKASLANAEAQQAYNQAEYQRQSTLGAKDFATQSTVQQWKSNVDQSGAAILNAKASIELANINLGYTQVLAPFDGIVTHHLVDVGSLVGFSGPTKLATIVQTDPMYVYFNLSEPQVLRIKETNAKAGLPFRTTDLSSIPVDIGLQGEQGYPHQGHMDYASPQVDQSTGTLLVRAVFDNKDQTLLPGLFVRVRTPVSHVAKTLMTSNDAIGTSQEGSYVLVVGKDNVVQRKVIKTGDRQGQLRIVESGLDPGDWVVTEGLQRAFPGAKVDPQRTTLASAAPAPSSSGASAPPIRRANDRGERSLRRNDAGASGPRRRDFALLHREAGPLQRDRAGGRADRPGGAYSTAQRAVSQRRPSDRAGHDALSRRQRKDRRRFRRLADRAERQRRREHDLHAVDQRGRRHLHAGGHFRDRHQPRPGAGPGPEPGGHRLVLASGRGSDPGRDNQEAVDLDPRIRWAGLARQPLRQPVPVELRRHQRAGRTSPPQRRGRRDGARRRAIRHAGLAEPGPASGAGPGAARRDLHHPAAEPGSHRRAGRRAACAERPGFSIYAQPKGPARRPGGVREHHRQGRSRQWRTDHPTARRRPRRARRPDLQRVVQPQRPAGRRDRRLAPAGSQRHRGRQRGEGEDGRTGDELPPGAPVRHPLRHDQIRSGRHFRGLQDADRGGDPGADRHSRLPAGLAGDAGAGDHGAGHADRRLRGDGGAWLFHQLADAVRPRAGDRHRGRRRDRHCRRRRALHRAWVSRPRGRRTGDGRPHRSGPRHHAGPDVGVHSRGFLAGVHRTALPAIRARHCLHRLHQRRQRPDPEAHAIRAVAQATQKRTGGATFSRAASTRSTGARRTDTPGSSAR